MDTTLQMLSEGSPSKKIKKNNGVSSPIILLCESEYPNVETINQSTVSILSNYCKRMGLKCSGTKPELVQRLYDKIGFVSESKVEMDKIIHETITSLEDVNPSDLHTKGLGVLKQYCKDLGLPQSGKKQELIQRIGKKMMTPSTEMERLSIEERRPRKKSGTGSINKELVDIIKRNNGLPEQIEILLNKKLDRFVHLSTQLVFDDYKIVCGRVEDDRVVCLTDVDIEQCKKYKFLYRVPTNLAKYSEQGGNTSDDIVEELDELDFSDEEDLDNLEENQDEEEEVDLDDDL